MSLSKSIIVSAIAWSVLVWCGKPDSTDKAYVENNTTASVAALLQNWYTPYCENTVFIKKWPLETRLATFDDNWNLGKVVALKIGDIDVWGRYTPVCKDSELDNALSKK